MGDQNLKINILPAHHGDCIHLRFWLEYQEQSEKNVNQMENQEVTATHKYKAYNIIIDSGPAKHKKSFARLMHSIRDSGEQVDLLCFTHVDDDHILAAEKFFGNPNASENAAVYVKKVWINIPKYETDRAHPKEPSDTEKLTADNAMDLYEYLLWHHIPCETWIMEGETMNCGEAEIRVVLPTPVRLDEYEAWWRIERPMEQLEAGDYDTSESNGSSITLLVNVFGNKLLFSGDSFAGDLETVAKRYAGDGFALVKLPHHGSKANITESMLTAMDCRRFVISANGTPKDLKKRRPATDTVELIHEYGAQTKEKCVTIYGNYEWEYIRELVSSKNLKGIDVITLKDTDISITDKIEIRTE